MTEIPIARQDTLLDVQTKVVDAQTYITEIQNIIGDPNPNIADMATVMNGLKSIIDFLKEGGSMGELVPYMHRNLFRGKSLGNTVTSAQKAAILDGSFDNLFVGDYWDIGGVRWRIVDINYWLGMGDTAFAPNHLVIMPDDQLYAAQMNATNITTGGYTNSEMRTTHLAQAKTTINTAFPGMVKVKRLLFENAVTNGRPSAGAWIDSDVDLPNEINMYGSSIFRPANDGTSIPYNYTVDKTQFALFQLVPRFIVTYPTRRHWWLRDPVSAAGFASVSNYGGAAYISASNSFGVRPCFAIG